MVIESLFLNERRVRAILSRLVAVSVLLVLLRPGMLMADPGWIVTRGDFQQEPVSLEGIDESGVRVMPVGRADSAVIEWDSFLQIERAAAGGFGQGKFVLMLLNGDRIVGEPTGFENEQLVWHSPAVGELTIPLKQARALVRSGASIGSLDEPPVEDVVYLNNGDRVQGIITEIEPAKVSVQGTLAMEIPFDAVGWIHFALAAPVAGPADRAYRIHLNDNSLITVDAVQSDGESLTLTLPGGAKGEVPLATVVGIEQLNGPVSWLSSRTPAQVVQIPYFGEIQWPTRMDRTVGGKPIQFGHRVFARGIGVHAYSRIDYALNGEYEAFRTQYAIAQEERRQYADVMVRIKVDGQVVHEQAGVKADVLSPVVMVELPREAKMLTLEVDYGEANDTQDRFNWIEPALLRKKPEPPTQPTTREAKRVGSGSGLLMRWVGVWCGLWG